MDSKVPKEKLFGDKCTNVALQFSFGNRRRVPPACLQFEQPELSDRKNVTSGQKGELVIPPTTGKWVDIADVFIALEELGFVPRGIDLEQRENRNGQKQGTYYMVRLKLARNVEVGADHADWQRRAFDTAVSEIVSFADRNFWRVRAFRNPCVRDGVVSETHHKVSICFEAPQPLYETILVDGKPTEVLIEARPNGQAGKLLGEQKEPLHPHFYLDVEDDELVLIDSE